MIINEYRKELLGIKENEEVFNFFDVFFVPGGHLVKIYHKNRKKYIEKIPKTSELNYLLHDEISYSSKLKLKDFILFCSKNIDYLYPVLGYDCDLFCKEALKKAHKYKNKESLGSFQDEIDHLLLSKRLEVKSGNQKEMGIVNGIDKWILSGIGSKSMMGAKNPDEKERYSIEMSPVAKMMFYDFKISNKIHLFQHSQSFVVGVENNLETITNKEMYDGDFPNLLSVLFAIFKSIGYYGNPLEKAKMLDSLEKRLQEI